MGNFSSILSDSNPSSSNSTTTMSSSPTHESKSEIEPTHESKSEIEPTHESKSETEETHQAETSKTQNPKEEDLEKIDANEKEEEEGECGFCLFMKGGGCKDSFIEWEKCIEEGEKNKEDIVEKCFEVTSALRKCMEVHSDYYAPILQAEKAAEAELEKEIDKQKEQGSEGNDAGSVPSEAKLEGSSSSS